MEHQRQQRARLRSALDELPAVVAPSEMHRLMSERGYEQDPRTGIWKRQVPPTRTHSVRDLGDGYEEHTIERITKPRHGPSWAGILAKRKRKKG